MATSLPDAPACAAPWSLAVESVLERLAVSDRGLSLEEVVERRTRHGVNELARARRRSIWRILLAQLQSVVIGLLAGAALLSYLLGDRIEAAAIGVVILVNTAIGFCTEWRAIRSMEALRRLGVTQVRVRRQGRESWVSAQELVPGDIVLLEAGDLIAADMRVLTASKLQVNESALTGESMPVTKSPGALPEQLETVERRNMLHSGTIVVRGSGSGVVTATGMTTTLGDIAALTASATEPRTPLEERLESLGRHLVWICLSLAVLTALAGIAAGKPIVLMIETAIALAVAAIPEGLPIVATLALARGMIRLARRRALLKSLAAVEALGSASILLCDKTGTLTEDRMMVRRMVLPDSDVDVEAARGSGREAFLAAGSAPDADLAEAIGEVLETVSLCSNASLLRAGAELDAVGDPVEAALLLAAGGWGLRRERLLQAEPEVREEPFDPATRMMATYHARGDAFRVAVKGAPEEVLQRCVDVRHGTGQQTLDEAHRGYWLRRSEELAGEGLRVLAVATRTSGSAQDPPYQGLTLLGLVGLLDPPRPEVRRALDAFRSAGVRVVMVTGDHAATARHIARSVGLASPDHPDEGVLVGRELREVKVAGPARERALAGVVFARTDPAQKLDLVRLHREQGETVAMIGDGVNDAPALRQADIGIAMGRRGTEVAREAADMILKDDALDAMVEALEQGRIIFENIRKFVFYLLSCNVGEFLVITLASLVLHQLPILPLQILFLNLVTDVFPALALGFGRGDPGIMSRPPRRPDAPILDASALRAIAVHGLVIAVTVLVAHVLALLWLDHDVGSAITVAFFTLAFAQLWHVFNARGAGTTLRGSDIIRNPWIWYALLLCSVLLVATVVVEPFSRVLHLQALDGRGWAIALVASLVPLLFGQTWLALRHATGSTRPGG